MQYIKIQSLWKRYGCRLNPETQKLEFDKSTNNRFNFAEYAEEGFGNIKVWDVEEKIDGTNIRIMWDSNSVRFGGRTDNAQIPTSLLSYLQGTFTLEKLQDTFPCEHGGCFPVVTLYGEGYGPKIQACGSNYSKTHGFMLFDVRVGSWWLQRQDVAGIAEKMGVSMPPQIGKMTEEKIIEFVKSNPFSRCSVFPQVMEGVICRSSPLMMFRNGKPVLFKLKCKDLHQEAA